MCVAGIGQCNFGERQGPVTNPTSSNGLLLTASSPRVAMGNVLILTIAGGTIPYKGCAVDDSTLGFLELTDSTHCKFTAYTKTGSVVARVTDAGNNTADYGIIVY